MGIFLALVVAVSVLLAGVMSSVEPLTVVCRFIIVFFIFGILGTFIGSFLEIFLMPVLETEENITLKAEMKADDSEIKAKLGDLLESRKSGTEEKSGKDFDSDSDEEVFGTESAAVDKSVDITEG